MLRPKVDAALATARADAGTRSCRPSWSISSAAGVFGSPGQAAYCAANAALDALVAGTATAGTAGALAGLGAVAAAQRAHRRPRAGPTGGGWPAAAWPDWRTRREPRCSTRRSPPARPSPSRCDWTSPPTATSRCPAAARPGTRTGRTAPATRFGSGSPRPIRSSVRGSCAT
ncbi:KR domain-containing protein [Streptacidiphilus sp. 4-A2]|nr:KR domain-containing protein [Streptacidiphilus sp. 4-A2]